MKSKTTPALELVKLCCRVLDDKKAEALTVLQVAETSSITDYLVLATATSEPHLRALRVEIEKALDATGTRIVGMETAQESGWVVIDAFDVMVHLFLKEPRERYGLERLWRDAAEVSVAKLLKPPTSKAAPVKRAPGKPPKRVAAARPPKRRAK
jgi:ribosome-associated protein